jgi:hypothetical protein
MQPDESNYACSTEVGRLRLLYGPFMAALARLYTCRVHMTVEGTWA